MSGPEDDVALFMADIESVGRKDDEIAALRAEVERLTAALLKRGLSEAPCDICGYKGPGYYQPKTHKCAAV